MLNLLPNRRKSLEQSNIRPETALHTTPSILPGVNAYISADGTGQIRREGRSHSLFERLKSRDQIKRQSFFNLDAFGSIFWKHIDGRTTLSEIARKMSDEFDWDLEATEKSVVDFSKTLTCRGLIELRLRPRYGLADLGYRRS